MNDFEQYAAQGWRLCAIDRGSKAPRYADWGTPDKAEEVSAAAAGLDGAGLVHQLSGTCAIDVDNLQKATHWLAERGVTLEELLEDPAAVRIESGRPGRTKLLYRLGKTLRTLKPTGSGLELRCEKAQDVLPPTIHPDTKKPYRWAYGDSLVGHWSDPPPLPAKLLAVWRQAIAQEPAAPAQRASEDVSAILAELRKLVKGKDPDCEYDTWLKIGMALHHEGRGTAEAFRIWDEWSAKGKKYQGQSDLMLHWRSFRSDQKRPLATAATIRKDTPATAEDFPEEKADAADKPSDTEKAMKKQAADRKAEAIALLERRLIYVCQLDRYLDTDRRDLLATDHAIQHRFTHLMPGKNGTRSDPVKILRESANRIVVDLLTFHPGEKSTFVDQGVSYANTYRALPLELLEPTKEERGYIEWLYGKIKDRAFRDWLLKFLAHIVQRPGIKIRSCPLIWSEATGTGKSTMLSAVPRELVGKPFHQEVDYTALEEKFNGYLRDKWVVSLKEFKAGTKAERVAVGKRLMPWITDDYIPIREMRTDVYTIPNRFILTATSNEHDAAPIDDNDRRWGVYELTTDPLTASEVREVVVGFFNGPRARGVLNHYFRSLSLTGFNPDMRPPDTEAKRAMIDASLSSTDEVLREIVEEQSGPFERECIQLRELQDYLRHRSVFVPTANRLGRWLKSVGASQRMMRDASGRTFRLWILRNAPRWSVVDPSEVLSYLSGEVVDSLLM